MHSACDAPIRRIAIGIARPSTIALLVMMSVALTSRAFAAFPGLTPDEARKLDPLLSAAAAPLVVLPAGRVPQALGPLAAVAEIELKAEAAVIPLLIQVRDGDVSGLERLGIAIDAVVGEVATARDVPIGKLTDIARRPEVTRIQAPERLYPMNDLSVPETRAPGAWALGATGQGVLVGIIDTGIDVNHPDFRKNDNTTRIKLLLDLSNPGSGPFGGTLFTESQINTGIIAPDVVGHGTHVAGTAAGGGRADSTFRGVAFESDLLIVNADRNGDGSFSEADIVNSLAFIDSVSTARSQPYVANLSLGGHGGAHDGSALQELAIDFLVRPGQSKKAIVVAAGNEHSTTVLRHAEGEVLPADVATGVEIELVVPNYNQRPGELNDRVDVSIWYEAYSSFAISIESPRGHVVGPFTPGQTNEPNGTTTPDGLVAAINAPNGTNPQNGDYEAYIILVDFGGSASPFPGTWTIRIAGAVGPFDSYVAFSTMNARFQGDFATSEGFVSEPGTAHNAITVGAYTTKTSWVDKDGFGHGLIAQIGEVASFSNRGPTRDGRIKPEIVAPGQLIASAFSADAPPGSPSSVFTSPFEEFPNFFILPGDRYAIQQGTSQATPHVAGAVALLFKERPEWDVVDVKRCLAGTTRTDVFTGAVPNNSYGNGKLDIENAFIAAAAGDSLPTGLPGDVDGDEDIDLADVDLAIDFVLERQSPTPPQEIRADMNADRIIDVGDVALILLAALGGPAPQAPEPLAADGNTWLLPVSVTADRAVAGMDIEVVCDTPGWEVLAGRVQAARPGVLARGAMRDGGGAQNARVIALSFDDFDLAGRNPVVLIPFHATSVSHDSEPPRWRVTNYRLLGTEIGDVAGKITLGTPERLLPAAFRVLPVSRNPSALPGPITFDLPGPAARSVSVGIYDVSGRLMAKIAEGMRAPGRHVVPWDGRGTGGRVLPAGIYWVRIMAGEEIASTRLTVVR